MSTIDDQAERIAARAAALAIETWLEKYPPAGYLTTAQAAAHLKVSPQFLEIARHRADNSGPPYFKLDRTVRYRVADLDAWMDTHRVLADQPAGRSA